MFLETGKFLLILVVGIPGAIVSLTLLVLGAARQNVKLSIIGTIVSVGFCYVVSAYIVTFIKNIFDIDYAASYFWLTFLVLIGGNLLSVLAVWKGSKMLAAISITPFVASVVWLSSIALGQ